jgi:hypothetical protein
VTSASGRCGGGADELIDRLSAPPPLFWGKAVCGPPLILG